MSEGILFVVTGPSGAGKTTIIKEILELYKEDLEFSVSYTTRNKRAGETSGSDYYYIDDSKFQEMVEKDAFLEFADVHGYKYGTSREYIESRTKTGKNVLLDIDVQGALNVKSNKADAVTVFVAPPSYSNLVSRLTGRGTENNTDLLKRLEDAKKELRLIKEFDYVIVNEDVDHSISLMKSIINSEKIRVFRMSDFLKQFM